MDELRQVCRTAPDLDWIPGTRVFFEYFASNYLFFSTMLASKGSPSFRSRFLEFLIEEFRSEVDTTAPKNRGLHDDVIVQFVATAYVGVLEWWLSNGMPYPPRVMAAELGILQERNL